MEVCKYCEQPVDISDLRQYGLIGAGVEYVHNACARKRDACKRIRKPRKTG